MMIPLCCFHSTFSCFAVATGVWWWCASLKLKLMVSSAVKHYWIIIGWTKVHVNCHKWTASIELNAIFCFSHDYCVFLCVMLWWTLTVRMNIKMVANCCHSDQVTCYPRGMSIRFWCHFCPSNLRPMAILQCVRQLPKLLYRWNNEKVKYALKSDKRQWVQCIRKQILLSIDPKSKIASS